MATTFSSHAIKTIPSVTTKPSSFLTTSNIKLSSPFSLSNHSLKLNSTLPHSSFTSVPKKSFTCRSQAQPVDSGNRHTSSQFCFFIAEINLSFLFFMLSRTPFWFLCSITMQKKSKNSVCTRSTSETVEALFTLD